MKDVKKELEQDEGQDKIDITKDKVMRVLRKTRRQLERSWS